MANVGVLSLEIQSNAEQAAGGLNRVADALTRVRNATAGGTGMASTAGELRTLTSDIRKYLNDDLITRMNNLASAIRKIRNASKGASIVFNISGLENMGSAVSSMKEAQVTMEKLKKTAEDISKATTTIAQAGLDKMGEGPAKLLQQYEQLNNTLQKVEGTISRIQNMNFESAGLERFINMFNQFSDMRSRMSLGTRDFAKLGAGPNTQVSNVFAGSGEAARVSYEELKNGAIEAEGTVTEAFKRLEGNTEESTAMAGEAIEQFRENMMSMQDMVKAMFGDNTFRITSMPWTPPEKMPEAPATMPAVQQETGTGYWTKLAESGRGDGKLDVDTRVPLDAIERAGDNYTAACERFVEKMRAAEQMFADSSKERQDMIAKSYGFENFEGLKAFNEQMASIGNGAGTEGLAEAEQRISNIGMAAEESAGKIRDMMSSGVSGGMVNVAPALDSMGGSMEQTGGQALVLNDDLKELDHELKQKQTDTNNAASAFRNLYNGLKDLVAGGIIGKLAKQFAQMAKRMAMRAIIRTFVSGVKEGLQNLYEYSKVAGTSFAPAMDQAATAIQQIKNSIAAALGPAIQAAIPLLQSFANAFINVMNYANQFLALLRGQATWTRALPATTSAFEKQTKAAKKTGAAIKDLLADWDELNIIQSETGGNGSGSTQKTAEDYLEMFEEVGVFDKKIKNIVDFAKNHFENIKDIVNDIGLALLAWKLSSSFTGWLGTLATIAKVGFIIKIAFDSTKLLDEAYVESEDIGYLIGDTVMTAALAGVAGKLASAQFGEGAGLITAGLTFAVSAGATFAVAKGIKDKAEAKTLGMLGGIKMGIGAALASMGFMKMGLNPLVSIVAGVITVGLTTEITMTLEMNAVAAKNAEEMAKEAFSSTGEGGINPDDYVKALKDEFALQTAGAKLVINAYVNVPDLKDKLNTAMTQISSFNQVIFHGDGKLTEEDANAFNAAWGTVIETLNTMNTARYNTILAGLTDALNTKSQELRSKVEEIRTTFIMLEQNLSAENAEIYKHMQDLTEKMKNGDRSEETLEEYQKYYRVFAAATRSGLESIQRELDKGKNFDFGDKDHAVENAKTFVQSVSTAAAEAVKAEEDALYDITESTEALRRVEQAKYEEGLIGEEEYKARMKTFDDIIEVATKYANEKKSVIEGKAQEAWNLVFEQALSAGDLSEAYWKEVLNPLMKEAKEAGYEVPQSVMSAFAEGVGSFENIMDFGTPIDSIINELKDKTAEEIASALNDTVETEFSGKKEGLEHALTNLILTHNNLGLTETQIEARNLLGVTGWNYWADDVKLMFMKSLREAVGDEKAKAVAEKLGFKWSLVFKNSNDTEYVNEARRPIEEIEKAFTESGEIIEDKYEEVEKTINNTFDAAEKLKKLDYSNVTEKKGPGYSNETVEETIKTVEDLTGDALAAYNMIKNAFNSGKGMDEINAAVQQVINSYPEGTFTKIQPFVQQLMDEYEKQDVVNLAKRSIEEIERVFTESGGIIKDTYEDVEKTIKDAFELAEKFKNPNYTDVTEGKAPGYYERELRNAAAEAASKATQIVKEETARGEAVRLPKKGIELDTTGGIIGKNRSEYTVKNTFGEVTAKGRGAKPYQDDIELDAASNVIDTNRFTQITKMGLVLRQLVNETSKGEKASVKLWDTLDGIAEASGIASKNLSEYNNAANETRKKTMLVKTGFGGYISKATSDLSKTDESAYNTTYSTDLMTEKLVDEIAKKQIKLKEIQANTKSFEVDLNSAVKETNKKTVETVSPAASIAEKFSKFINEKAIEKANELVFSINNGPQDNSHLFKVNATGQDSGSGFKKLVPEGTTYSATKETEDTIKKAKDQIQEYNTEVDEAANRTLIFKTGFGDTVEKVGDGFSEISDVSGETSEIIEQTMEKAKKKAEELVFAINNGPQNKSHLFKVNVTGEGGESGFNRLVPSSGHMTYDATKKTKDETNHSRFFGALEGVTPWKFGAEGFMNGASSDQSRKAFEYLFNTDPLGYGAWSKFDESKVQADVEQQVANIVETVKDEENDFFSREEELLDFIGEYLNEYFSDPGITGYKLNKQEVYDLLSGMTEEEMKEALWDYIDSDIIDYIWQLFDSEDGDKYRTFGKLKLPPGAQIMAAGAGIQMTGAYGFNTSADEATAQTARSSSNIEGSMKTMTANQDEQSVQFGQMVDLLRRILNKEFVAKVVPSSSYGYHNRASEEMLERITGEGR